jgi:hypothetical protein
MSQNPEPKTLSSINQSHCTIFKTPNPQLFHGAQEQQEEEHRILPFSAVAFSHPVAISDASSCGAMAAQESQSEDKGFTVAAGAAAALVSLAAVFTQLLKFMFLLISSSCRHF